MLYTKSILHPVSTSDGIRISVMSRHTLNDGITPDPRIVHFDLHLARLGPSPRLIGDHYKRGLPWVDFETRYLAEISSVPTSAVVHLLAQIALSHDIMFLCIEDTAEHCHRRLLAEACLRYQPRLIVKHL